MLKVNSPGKILFYGGYSVLMKGHPSLVIGVVDEEGRGVTAKASVSERRLISKQFSLDFQPDYNRKELVNYAYLVAEAYLKAKGSFQPVTVELENSPIYGSDEEKSGLGSSAGATASVVKAVLSANGYDPSFHSETVFKLSQMAYAIYANKVGSGFDIAVASFGHSIVYYRYNPGEIVMPTSMDEQAMVEAVKATVDKPWTWVKVESFPWPSKYDVLFFNVKGGKTSTIKAVKAFKEFKKAKLSEFEAIMQSQKEAEEKAIAALKDGDDEAIRQYTHAAREAHKKLQEGIRSVVPEADAIEPEPLSRVIEKAERLQGVVAGRCPGAGGWDGLAFIVRKDFADIPAIIDFGREEGLAFHHVPLRVL